ncbi:MAG: GTP-binding protein [Thermomicrobiales bacterium]
MAIVNLGILAHVDAGKTSLTERILFERGVIESVGSVDKGTTQTDTMELERARGITIKSAVVSFHLHDLKVNLIDTPGHTDFVAEVERSLQVLDAVVLVISAVEGVQSQTRRLVQAVCAAHLPMIIFVNKIDRLGARGEPLLEDISRKLKLRVVPLTTANGLGDRTAEVFRCDRQDSSWRAPVIDLLAESNEEVIAEFDRTDGNLNAFFLDAELREQVAAGAIVPILFGSAVTGAGVPDLLDGIEHWLPPASELLVAPVEGTVFKIARRSSGEKIAYVRLFAGSLAVRERVTVHTNNRIGDNQIIEERITGIERFESGGTQSVNRASAGEIVVLHGMRAARIGDRIGDQVPPPREFNRAFPAPVLESVVRPIDARRLTPLREALEQLSEQDPLISLRQRNDQGEISVRLFGEVQKEVIADTLALEFGIAVTFEPSQTICIERPVRPCEHAESISDVENPFCATLGFRIEPAKVGSGIHYVHDLGSLPLAYYRAIEETVHETLTQGLRGWEVTDCIVTLTQTGFVAPLSTAADFRKLTPLVLMRALCDGGTLVCEPIEELDLEIPENTFGTVCGALVSARGSIRNAIRDGSTHLIVCDVPTSTLRTVEQQLPGLTRGEGSWVTSFAGYLPVSGDTPVRARLGPNPLNRSHYLAEVAQM